MALVAGISYPPEIALSRLAHRKLHPAIWPETLSEPRMTKPMSPDRRLHPPTPDRAWWERSDRHYDGTGQLWLAGRRAGDLARETGTPAYVYDAARVGQNVRRLREAIARIDAPSRLLYAMKSNRHPPLLRYLGQLGLGIDACSPGEVRLALDCGFAQQQISFTAGNLSRADHAALADWPELWFNADSLSALQRIAAASPGRRIGLRINPAIGIAYADNARVSYAGVRPTKFGVYLDRFEEALELADKLGLKLLGLHCHAGCGFLDPQLQRMDAILSRIGEFLARAPQIERVNLGGGLGIPLREGDRPLDLDAWSGLVSRHFGGRGLFLEFEPGDYLVKDAGALLTEVTQVEEKGGQVFVGLNAGFNLHPEPVFYDLPLVAAPALRRPGEAQTITLAGNINEAHDLWAEALPLPPLQEGDILCLLNAGGYGASMASNHCLRGSVGEHLLALEVPAHGASPTQLAEANKRAWDALYAQTGELVWGEEPLPFLAHFAGDIAAALREPARLLDAGCGEGRNLPFLLELGAAEVHALDASQHALDKIPAELAGSVRSHLGDLAASGLESASFDAITLLDTFETLPDADRVLVEMHRLLKPGGLLLCNIPGFDDGVSGEDMQAVGEDAFLYRRTYYFRFVDAAQAESILRAAGFEILRSEHHSWIEAAHPGFRSEEHAHTSHVLLVRRPPGQQATPC